jgi:hypothetical protein
VKLEDRLDLLELQALYGHILDRHEWGRLDEIYADDAVFDATSVGVPAMHGLAEIREKLIPLEESGVTLAHHSTNAVVLEAGETSARMLSKYITHHLTAAVSFGEYEDELVKTADGWRIARRTARRIALGSAGTS